MDRLFASRGLVLALIAAVGLGLGRGGSLLVAAPWLAAGLALRGWAFRWLGPQGRTRDPARPSALVTGGPYALLRHPVYVGNVLVAAGLVVALRPAGVAAALLLGLVTGVYAALAKREHRLLQGLAGAPIGPRLDLRAVLRSERSTYLSTALMLALASLL